MTNKRSPFIFKQDLGPTPKSGYTYLNQDLRSDSYADDFVPVPLKNGKVGYTSKNDGRLKKDTIRWVSDILDKPPLDSNVRIDNSLYEKQDRSTNGYIYYSNIDKGQIVYYTNAARQDAYYDPLFVNPSYAVGSLYKNPMGTVTSEYNRIPIKKHDHMRTKDGNYNGQLSWIHDSQEHREDLQALRMRKHNEQRHELQNR